MYRLGFHSSPKQEHRAGAGSDEQRLIEQQQFAMRAARGMCKTTAQKPKSPSAKPTTNSAPRATPLAGAAPATAAPQTAPPAEPSRGATSESRAATSSADSLRDSDNQIEPASPATPTARSRLRLLKKLTSHGDPEAEGHSPSHGDHETRMDSHSHGSHAHSRKAGIAAVIQQIAHFPEHRAESRKHHWLSKADEKIEPQFVEAPREANRQRLELVQAELIQLHSIDLITQSYKCQVYMQFAFRGGTNCPDLSQVSAREVVRVAPAASDPTTRRR